MTREQHRRLNRVLRKRRRTWPAEAERLTKRLAPWLFAPIPPEEQEELRTKLAHMRLVDPTFRHLRRGKPISNSDMVPDRFREYAIQRAADKEWLQPYSLISQPSAGAVA